MASTVPTRDEIDNAGRIHKSAYVASVSALFAICWLAAAVRFYVRFGMQKIFSVDDVFLIIGLACMTTMFGLLISCMEDAYDTAAVLAPNGLSLALQPGFIQEVFGYKKIIDATLILAWLTIVCVKLSYLFLFRRLIDRLRYMNIYWWFVLLYVIGSSGYVVAVYYLVCPYYNDFKAIQCITGDGVERTLRYTLSQIILDIIGDLLIFVIPVHLIWKIKIQTRQKVGLATSLCLTVVIITMAIIRVAGVITPDSRLDQLWDGYWNIIEAEVGLIMTSATAFRALYINKTGGAAAGGRRRASSSGRTWIAQWWYKAKSKRRTHEEIEGKELSAGSDWSWSNNRVSTDAPQIPRRVLPRGQSVQNTMVSGQGVYDSKLRMSAIIDDPWDDRPINVDEELQTRRHEIEPATVNYSRQL